MVNREEPFSEPGLSSRSSATELLSRSSLTSETGNFGDKAAGNYFTYSTAGLRVAE